MSQPTDDPTRITLLHRLRQEPEDPSAWAEFVGRYGEKILDWCRRWRLQEADAQDVSQTVLLRLAVKLRTFDTIRPGRFGRGCGRSPTTPGATWRRDGGPS